MSKTAFPSTMSTVYVSLPIVRFTCPVAPSGAVTIIVPLPLSSTLKSSALVGLGFTVNVVAMVLFSYLPSPLYVISTEWVPTGTPGTIMLFCPPETGAVIGSSTPSIFMVTVPVTSLGIVTLITAFSPSMISAAFASITGSTLLTTTVSFSEIGS